MSNDFFFSPKDLSSVWAPGRDQEGAALSKPEQLRATDSKLVKQGPCSPCTFHAWAHMALQWPQNDSQTIASIWLHRVNLPCSGSQRFAVRKHKGQDQSPVLQHLKQNLGTWPLIQADPMKAMRGRQKTWPAW